KAAVVAAPVRIGGGTRLKIVEGLAMGKAMVSTSLGCEGIPVRDRAHLMIANEPEACAARIIELFDHPRLGAELGHAGRCLVEREYSWELASGRLEPLYRHVAERASSTADGSRHWPAPVDFVGSDA
ncbi:MAG: glycosyltransferase, partial [Solirubrobacterales bacterium]|nr:glycosyltransferase [Solirubrobacterales bacterium]